ncbi:multidrug transporter [Microbacteriaceae bacterium VKM Ac-2854]|nr:multidrug transporter [Microbacteriaceae bacterium VKM Ac-2854]
MAEPSFDDNRHDQLTSAPKSTEADAKPRIDTTRVDAETVRIDIRDDASARPGEA